MAFNSGAGPAPTSYECQHCGAKLPPPTAEGTQICNYCQAVYQVQREASSPQGFTIVFGGSATGFGNVPPTMGSFPQPSAQAIDAMMNAGVKTAKWSLFIGLFITIIIIAAVAVPLYFVFKDGFGSFTTSSGTNSAPKLGGLPGAEGIDLTIGSGEGLLLPGEPAGSQNVVVLTTYYDQSAKKSITQVARIDTGGKKIAWRAKPFDDVGGVRTMAIDFTNVYVDDKSTLRAIKLSDGTDAWAAPLPDKLKSGCDACLIVAGNRILARTDEGSINAIDAATGKPVWNRKTKDNSARAIAMGDTVLVVDGEKGDYTLTLVNAADGSEKGVINPQCGTGRSSFTKLRYDSQILPVPLENAVLLGFGTSTGCWQKYDLTNPAAPVFSATVENGYLDSGDVGTAFGDNQMLWTQSSSGPGASVLDLATGTARPLLTDAEYRFVAVGITNGKAILRAKNQRGTQKLSIWGVDMATGQKAWEKSLGEAESLDPPDETPSGILTSNESFATIRVNEGKVRVLQVTDSNNEVKITSDSLDPATGVAAAANPAISLGKTIGANQVNLLGWNASRAVLVAAGRVQVVDTNDGKQVATVP